MARSTILSRVTRRAGELVAAEQAFREAVTEAHMDGASIREIEQAARKHEEVGSRRGFTRERIRTILVKGVDQR